jgi:hypothetical protein
MHDRDAAQIERQVRDLCHLAWALRRQPVAVAAPPFTPDRKARRRSRLDKRQRNKTISAVLATDASPKSN